MKLAHFRLHEDVPFDLGLEAQGIRDHPRLLILAFTNRHEEIATAQAAVRERFREARFVGVTGAGAIGGGTTHDEGPLLVFLDFHSTEVDVVWVDEAAAESDFELGARLAERILDHGRPTAVLVWLSNLTCNGDAVLGGLGSRGMRSPLFGVLAADDLQYRHTRVFSLDRVLEQGGAAVVLRGSALQVQGFHSLDWVPLGRTLEVTSNGGSRIDALDGVPALAMLERYLGKKASDRFVRLSSQFPLIVRRRDLDVARRCVGLGEGGSLVFSGSFSTGDQVRFGLGNLEQALESIRTVQKALRRMSPEGILLFPSAARRRLLRACSELETRGYPEIAPVAGLFNYGQFFNDGNGNEFSNNLLLAVGITEAPGSGHGTADSAPGTAFLDPGNSTTQIELQAIAQLAIAASQDLTFINESLEQLATTDPLTEVYNRRKIQDLIEQELARVRRYGNRAALIMMDLDDFKQINDSYGHDVGDLILRSVTSAIREQLRETDAIGRWGGEEFIVLCPATELNDAVRLAERIRRYVERAHGSPGSRITLSVGVTELAATDALHSLLARADSALYAAKNAGKNTVRAIPAPGEP